MTSIEEDRLRRKMVEEQIAKRGIADPLVLSSMLAVPRHLFVPASWSPYAYEDAPLPIENGQTISQPFIVALMTAAACLTKESRVLEIGTGSGYAAAVLSRIAAHVYTIERFDELANKAKACFQRLGYANITVKTGDGSLGWEEEKPFNAIIVTAGAPVAPERLLSQLALHGRLVIPIGSQFIQELRCYFKIEENKIEERTLERVRFVPLIGEHGWKI